MFFLLCLLSQVHLVCVSVWISSLWTCTHTHTHTHTQIQVPSLGGPAAVLSGCSVFMWHLFRGANAAEPFNSQTGRRGQETVMDGWTVTREEPGGGAGGGGEDGWGKMLLWGGVSYPRPMAAPLLRWMKAPRPAVVAVTNLLRFSARLEARGRGSPSHHHQHHPTISFPSCLPQHSQCLHPSFQRS